MESLHTHTLYNCWEPARPSHFVGRDRELRTIDLAINNRRGVSLVGDLHIGKSSLLYALEAFYRSQGRHITFISGLDRAGQSVRHFVESITGRCVADEPDRAADVLAAWAEAQAKPEQPPPLLLVDDVESCFQRFPVRFFERLRGMLYKLVPVFASTRELDLIHRHSDYPPVSPLENRLEIVRLGLLSANSAALLRQRSEGILEQSAQHILRQWAGEHPYYIHLLGVHLLQAQLQNEDIQNALDHVYAHARPHLRLLWRGMNKSERSALLASVRGQTVPHRGLRLRGLLNHDGRVFGQILSEWLQQEGST
jgi:hypothetical protein